MRIPRSALVAGALASLLLGGTAHAAAAPAYKPVLTKNPLYKTGKLGFDTCEEPAVRSGSVEEVKGYLDAVLDCLNAAWAPRIEQAGFTFSKPTVRVITKPRAETGCGRLKKDEEARYCGAIKRITYLVSPYLVEAPDDLRLMLGLAHEYGHHVQQLTGIPQVQRKAIGEGDEAARRYELQAYCMAGVFVGSVWHSLNRQESELTSILNSGTGLDLSSIGVEVESPAKQKHGSDTSTARWLKRGYDTESAGGCNTWKAPKSQVS